MRYENTWQRAPRLRATPDAAATIHDDPERVWRLSRDRDLSSGGCSDHPCHRLHGARIFSRDVLPLWHRLTPRISLSVQTTATLPTSNRIHRFELMRHARCRGLGHLLTRFRPTGLADMTRMCAILGAAVHSCARHRYRAGRHYRALCDPQVRRMADAGVILVSPLNGHTSASL